MTVKGKRAKSIKRVDASELAKLDSGGQWDDSIPESRIDTILKSCDELDAGLFKAFFAQHVAIYRSLLRSSESQIPINEQRKLLDEAMKLILELRTRLTHLPEYARSYVEVVAHQQFRQSYSAHAQSLDVELRKTDSMLLLTDRKLEALSKLGAKNKSDRDWFLSQLVEWLATNGIRKKVHAYTIAFQVARTVVIDLPPSLEDPDEMAKLVKHWKRGKSPAN